MRGTMALTILSISQLNFYVKSVLETNEKLRSVYLKGEISNLTDHQRSGHIYLTLKDEKSAVRAVMFAGSAKYLKFRPENGMTVLVRGRVSLYEATGAYQVYIDDMQPDGIGALNLAFEQLKKKLSAEGLFDEAYKKPLPTLPKKIGVITSPTGAAVQDISRILKRRYPIGEIVMCPILVQGDDAAGQLTDAVEKLNRLQCADVIIIGRGGGSIEDLQAFNDETLARAIFASKIPVISAVGHETDFTICDFVADVRASTPSAGAELATPDLQTMYADLAYFQEKLSERIHSRITFERRRLDELSKANVLRSPLEAVDHMRIRLDVLSRSLMLAYSAKLSEEQEKFAGINAKLDALSPLKILSRGYSITMRGGEAVRSVQSVGMDENIDVILSDGTLKCKVILPVPKKSTETKGTTGNEKDF